MKKILGFSITIFVVCFIAGCASDKKTVIPALHYHDEINIHVAKKAYIYWNPGREVAAEKPHYHGSNSGSGGGVAGLIVDLVSSSIENEQRKNHPSEYLYDYGKADQTVFITSLRDILEQQNVFKSVELVTDLTEIRPQDVLIKVSFKSTRVIRDIRDHDYLITLAVKISIQSNNRFLKERTYVVRSEPYTYKTFLEKKSEVSQKVLTEILDNLKQWHKAK